VGNYVLITGASAGIGVAYADEVAKAGYGTILVARRKEKLEHVAEKIRQRYNTPVEIITADLALPKAAEEVIAQVLSRNLPVAGLINNAGFGDRGYFADLSLVRQKDMVQVNIVTLLELCHRIIPLMAGKPDAFIINVASTAAFQAGPEMTTYYATKAFVLSFSEALSEELKEQGIAVSVTCPGATKTEFAAEASMVDAKMMNSPMVMTAEEVARISFAGRNRTIVVPGLANLLGTWSVKLTPRSISRKVARWVTKGK
jgi:hypothetical protein